MLAPPGQRASGGTLPQRGHAACPPPALAWGLGTCISGAKVVKGPAGTRCEAGRCCPLGCMAPVCRDPRILPWGAFTFVVPKQGLLRSAQTPVDVLQLLCHQRDLHRQHCELHLGSRGSCRRELRAGGNPLCPLGRAPRVRLGVPGHQHRAGRSRCLGSATPTCRCCAGVP